MNIAEIKDMFDDIFKNIKVKSIKTIYEKTDTDDYKLIISLHMISKDSIIAHTKFIFLVDATKSKTVDNTFSYLYDMNCVYRKIDFKNLILDLKDKIIQIIETKDFGKNFKNLNRFISDTPITNINNILAKNNITAISVYTLEYTPKFKIAACDETTYDFVISLSNGFEIALVLNKDDKFIFTYKFLDITKTFDYYDISNMASKVATTLVELLEDII